MHLNVHKKGLGLNQIQQNKKNSNNKFGLDTDILNIALNRSFIKKMAGSSETLSVDDLVD